MIKKILKTLGFIVFLYLFIALLFEEVTFFGRYQHYAVPTTSMAPVINEGDLVIADHKYPIDDYQVGDILLFNADVGNETIVIIHYIHEIEETETGYIFTTISEALDTPDPYETTEAEVVGRYVTHIPRVGTFLRFITHPIGKVVVIIDVILIYAFYKVLTKDKPKVEEPSE